MAKMIKNHNKKVTSKVAAPSSKCNCRAKDTKLVYIYIYKFGDTEKKNYDLKLKVSHILTIIRQFYSTDKTDLMEKTYVGKRKVVRYMWYLYIYVLLTLLNSDPVE